MNSLARIRAALFLNGQFTITLVADCWNAAGGVCFWRSRRLGWSGVSTTAESTGGATVVCERASQGCSTTVSSFQAVSLASLRVCRAIA